MKQYRVGDKYSDEHRYSRLVGTIVYEMDIRERNYKPLNFKKNEYISLHFRQGEFEDHRWYIHKEDLIPSPGRNSDATHLLTEEAFT